MRIVKRERRHPKTHIEVSHRPGDEVTETLFTVMVVAIASIDLAEFIVQTGVIVFGIPLDVTWRFGVLWDGSW